MGDRLIMVARVLLGLSLGVFGANGLFHFLPDPPKLPGDAQNLLNAMIDTGYLMQLVCIVQIACGVALLLNRLVPLALLVLTPVSVNILCFHLALAPGAEAIPGYVVFAINVLLLIAYRRQLTPVLAYKSNPGDV